MVVQMMIITIILINNIIKTIVMIMIITREIINNRLAFYKSNHPLDELGIDENYLGDNLVTLTELIQPELKLMELETIEKLSNE